MSTTASAASADPPKGGKGKGKKSGKGEKLDLDLVLGQTANWNMIMEDDEDDDYSHRGAPIELPSAPKSLTSDSDVDQIPINGPFKAYVSNIAYELTEEEVTEAFNSFLVSNVTMVRDSKTQQVRGVTIEFQTRKDLIDAINTMNGKSLKNRNIRVQVSNQILPDRYGDRMGDRGRRGYGGADTTPSDWRSGPARDTIGHGGRVLPPPSFEESRGGYGGRRREEGGGFGGMGGYAPPPSRDDEYGYDRSGFGGRRDRDRDFGRDRDRGGQWGRGGGDEEMGGNWRSSAREPAAAPPADYNPPRRSYEPSREAYREREPYPSQAPAHHEDYRRDDFRGGARRDEYYNPPRDYERREPVGPPRERLPSTRSVDSHGHSGEDYAKSDEDGSVKGRSTRPSAVTISAFKALVLEEKEAKPASYNSIFGSAKPVDTLQKEKEIEQKLASSKAAALVPNSERPPPDDHRSTRRDRDRMGRRENGRRDAPRDGPRFDERNGALAGGERRRREDSRRGDHIERRDDRRSFGFGSGDSRARRDDRPAYDDDRRGPMRYNDYSNRANRERYSSGGSDYQPDDGHSDMKPSYATSNKFDRLNDAEDHVSDD